MKKFMTGIGCLLTASSLFAASAKVTVGDHAFYVETGTAEGRCISREVQEGSRETVCTDGQNVAAVSTLSGCLDSSGTGYCAKDLRRPAGLAGSQLTCIGGVSYFLLVGPEARCTQSAGSKACRTTDGSSTAFADCADGCGSTTGAGNCCRAGTSGCPPEMKTP